MIKNITIQNIKGYGNPPTTLDVELKTNRVNLLFAPNGSGKSSLAAAFLSLKSKKLEVAKENKHYKNDMLQSSLSLDIDGVTYTADSTKNDISPILKCNVIKIGTEVHTTQHKMGNFTAVSGYLDIADIVVDKVFPSVTTGYGVTTIRNRFGTNKKILANLETEMENPQLLQILKGIYKELNSFMAANSRKKLVDDILQKINNLRGNTDEVISHIQSQWFVEIEANPIYQTITNALANLYPSESSCDKFLRFFQIVNHWNLNKQQIKDATSYQEYLNRRKLFDANLQLLDNTWKDIHTDEIGGQLVVRFPQENEISNGQRDLLTFLVNIIKFRMQISPNKKYLLLIDEVFDYLDDANMIVAQYYLSKLLEEWKSYENLYLCILSHLNPFTFRSYVFSDKKINPQYLVRTVPTATKKMLAFIACREKIGEEGKKGDIAKSELYKNLSHDLFHYNPIVKDYSAELDANHLNNVLDKTWGKTQVLHQVLVDEVNKYLSDQPQYDPYAVAMALRLRIEKMLYEQLQEQRQKDEFIDKKMTKNKLAYCEDLGMSVPDTYYIISAIHNEADHVKFNGLNDTFIEKPMVYKLQHIMIKGILRSLFGWNGNPLTTNVID